MDNSILIAVITGIVQVIKMTQKVPEAFMGLIALGLGLALGVGLDFSVVGLINGFVMGLSSIGLYEVVIKPVMNKTE